MPPGPFASTYIWWQSKRAWLDHKYLKALASGYHWQLRSQPYGLERNTVYTIQVSVFGCWWCHWCKMAASAYMCCTIGGSAHAVVYLILVAFVSTWLFYFLRLCCIIYVTRTLCPACWLADDLFAKLSAIGYLDRNTGWMVSWYMEGWAVSVLSAMLTSEWRPWAHIFQVITKQDDALIAGKLSGSILADKIKKKGEWVTGWDTAGPTCQVRLMWSSLRRTSCGSFHPERCRWWKM